jgi:hypothetical protein
VTTTVTDTGSKYHWDYTVKNNDYLVSLTEENDGLGWFSLDVDTSMIDLNSLGNDVGWNLNFVDGGYGGDHRLGRNLRRQFGVDISRRERALLVRYSEVRSRYVSGRANEPGRRGHSGRDGFDRRSRIAGRPVRPGRHVDIRRGRLLLH